MTPTHYVTSVSLGFIYAALVVGFLHITNHSPEKTFTNKHLENNIETLKKYPIHTHTTLYLDRQFDEVERAAITQAAAEWTSSTHHLIEFEVKSLPATIDPKQALIIVKGTPDYPDILALDSGSFNKTIGLFVDDSPSGI
jgi:hypothetical protein